MPSSEYYSGSSCCIRGSRCCIRASRCCIGGSRCCIRGSRCCIGGSRCCIGGSRCCIWGYRCCIRGSRCCIRRFASKFFRLFNSNQAVTRTDSRRAPVTLTTLRLSRPSPRATHSSSGTPRGPASARAPTPPPPYSYCTSAAASASASPPPPPPPPPPQPQPQPPPPLAYASAAPPLYSASASSPGSVCRHPTATPSPLCHTQGCRGRPIAPLGLARPPFGQPPASCAFCMPPHTRPIMRHRLAWRAGTHSAHTQ